MSNDTLKLYKEIIYADKVFDVNFQNMSKELYEEIERLNNLLKETSQTLSEQTTKAITLKSENERLNNIINELVKFMDEDYEYYEKYGYAEQGHAMGQISRIKNKLQELKGSDKE